ncbi:MAG: PhnD/SsuA/transferrin family substrate-binding protein, partial [Gammaproteobacteria bacterium]|nr:PhnD/SsuA/transferrin family substrate-binding protein [Gammaproteobacteria bacterium]
MSLSVLTQATAADEPLVLGIFPRVAATVVHDSFDPLAKYLSAELHRDVKIETTKDQNTFSETVAAKRYDIVHFNQLNYVESHQSAGYDVVAINEEFGKGTVAGALVVRKDSGIKNISDLRGKTIVFGGGPKAMVAYIANVVLLQKAGLKRGDYKEEFAKSPVNAMTAVFHKQAIAGGAGDIGLK